MVASQMLPSYRTLGTSQNWSREAIIIFLLYFKKEYIFYEGYTDSSAGTTTRPFRPNILLRVKALWLKSHCRWVAGIPSEGESLGAQGHKQFQLACPDPQHQRGLL